MKKIYAIIFAILFLAINYSCKNEKISVDSEKEEPYISATKINGKLLIQKEINGKIEFIDQLITDKFIATPFIDDKNLLAIRVIPKSSPYNKNVSSINSDWQFTIDASVYICDGNAMRECVSTGDFYFYEDYDCKLRYYAHGYHWSLNQPIYYNAWWTDERDYLRCWVINDPVGTVN